MAMRQMANQVNYNMRRSLTLTHPPVRPPILTNRQIIIIQTHLVRRFPNRQIITSHTHTHTAHKINIGIVYV